MRGARAPDLRAAGRGVLSVGGAKGLFVLLGFVVTWAVPRLLGSPAAYGRLTAVTTALAILTNTLTQASVQSTSKLVSEREDEAPVVVRRAFALALGAGTLAASLFAAVSPPVSARVFGDPTLAPLFLVGALVLVGVPVYAAGVGALNGGRRFGAQARLDAGYSVARTVGLVGGAALGLGALGAAAGFAAAVLVMAGVSVVVVGLGRAAPGGHARALLSLWVPVAAHTLALNAVLQLDVELLMAAVAAMLRGEGVAAAEAAAAAADHGGLYRTAQSLAFVPYQLSIALTLVVFPLVSRATGAGDREAARATVRGALRFAVLWLVLCEAPLAGAGGRVLDLLFPDAFVRGADALPLLCLSQVLFALFALASTVLTGAGRPWHAFGAALAGVVAVVLTTLGALALVGPHGAVRVAASSGACAGASVGLVAALALVRALLGPVVPWASFARALAAGGAAALCAAAVPVSGGLGALLALAAGALVYLAALAALGELRALRPRVATRPDGPRP